MGAFLGLATFMVLYGTTQFVLPIVLVYFGSKPRDRKVSPALLVAAAIVAVAAYIFWHADAGLELTRILLAH